MASVGCKLVISARRKQELERVKAKCSGEEQQTSNPILKSPVSCSKSAQFCALNWKIEGPDT